MHAVIVGGGVAGLGTALTLSRQGHRVTLVERDATPLPADPHAAFAWERRGAPQVRHSHAFLARLRNLLRDAYPDVLDALFDAGATELRFCDNLPEAMTDRAPMPGDEDLVALACRRTTFEWVLRRVVLADGLVVWRDGAAVTGLDAEASHLARGRGAPLITGVRLDDGSSINADLTVVASGHRSALDQWLTPQGVTLPETAEDTGIIYLSRFYRLLEGAAEPPQEGPIAGDLGYLKFAVFPGDNGTFSITLALGAGDAALRRRLALADEFDRVAACLPAARAWIEPDRSEAITEVHVMARLENRRRSFLDDTGAPRVQGLHAVGDAHTCTNPLYGRGCSLAFVQAQLLAGTVADHPADPEARARHYEAGVRREVHPWYRAAVAQDRDARRRAEAALTTIGPAPTSAPEAATPDDNRAILRTVLAEGLLPAVRTDPVVFRAFLRLFNLLTPPDALLTDGDVITRVMAVYADRADRAPEPPAGPERDELLTQLAEPAA